MAEANNDAWERFLGDFRSMDDDQIDRAVAEAQTLIDREEEWIEAVASWKAAGKPRRPKVPPPIIHSGDDDATDMVVTFNGKVCHDFISVNQPHGEGRRYKRDKSGGLIRTPKGNLATEKVRGTFMVTWKDSE